ncbi:hypothetical protein MN608_08840 [Microdochium nivale]|nr:hypothetical protein MN608_08840 [Microdochium nivale]
MLSHAAHFAACLAAAIAVAPHAAVAVPQAFTLTNAAGETMTFLPTTTLVFDPSIVTMSVGVPMSSIDEGTMIVSLPVEPTTGTDITFTGPVVTPEPGTPTGSSSVQLPGGTTITATQSSSPSSAAGSTTTTGSLSSSGAASTSNTPTATPGAAPRVASAAPAGLAAAVAGFLFL